MPKVTADERIEELFQQRGHTLTRLPKDYGFETICLATEEAKKWVRKNHNDKEARGQYLCHCCDVINEFENITINLMVELQEAKDEIERLNQLIPEKKVRKAKRESMGTVAETEEESGTD